MAKKLKATTLENNETVVVDNTFGQTTGTSNLIIEPNTVLTHKQILEALHAEMTKYGIHSIGQLEVLISKQ